MEITTIICDKCGKTCCGDYFIVYRQSCGRTVGKGDICEPCYEIMLKALNRKVTKNEKDLL